MILDGSLKVRIYFSISVFLVGSVIISFGIVLFHLLV